MSPVLHRRVGAVPDRESSLSSVAAALSYAREHDGQFVAELIELVRFPSVGAQPKHADDIKQCAAWLTAHLRGIGLENVVGVPTAGHPMVYADWRHAPGQPTVLIYGHYDVQPADPLAEWRTPPFEPAVRGDDLFGRGASDDKGQLFAHVKAVESCLRAAGRLPVNVLCLFEGEEEIGSPNLPAFLEGVRGRLGADVAVISDMQMLGADRPTLTYGLRGALSVEVEVRGPAADLHSGNFGGAIHNPLQALCELLAGLHDAGGRVTIPGFYDRVRTIGERERAYMARFGAGDAEILRSARAEAGWGERGFTLGERIAVRPALTINGLTGGYQGPGGKSIIPSRTSAKLNFRLVPDQEPREIERLLRACIAARTPPTVRVTIRTQSVARPALMETRHPAMRAAAQAYRAGFGVAPVLVRSGGTIPVASMFQDSWASRCRTIPCTARTKSFTCRCFGKRSRRASLSYTSWRVAPCLPRQVAVDPEASIPAIHESRFPRHLIARAPHPRHHTGLHAHDHRTELPS
jgi:acetylornithine deacetylase/succinyl-diaminopimelate desuccinylase-like protein